jgi:hypothetical protein
VLERNLEKVAVPIVVDKEAVEAVHMVVVHTEMEVAVPIVVRMEIEVVRVVRMAVEAVHTEVVEVAVPNLAVGLDHKTRIIPPVGYSFFFIAPFEANVQYHTTGVRANRQVALLFTNIECFQANCYYSS